MSVKTAEKKAALKAQKAADKKYKPTLMQDIKKNPWLYLLCLPAIAFFVIFAFIPMAGLYIAFVDYRPMKGIWFSDFVGLENFKAFFATSNWITVTVNTLWLNVLFIAFTTFTSVVIAVMLTEMKNKWVKKVTQSIVILPHFMPESAVTVSCLVNNDPSKIVVVGTPDTYYISNDHSMNVTFDVPALDSGYIYKPAEIAVPARANTWNASNMKASINSNIYDTGADVSLSDVTVKAGAENTLTITNEGSGVDYYSYIGGWNGSGYDYPQTASNLPTLTLTKAVYAETTEVSGGERVADADINKDAKGFYINDLAIPSWNPTLKWQVTFKDNKKASKNISVPNLSGGGSINIGLVVYGNIGEYTTDNITSVAIVE